MAAEWTTGNPSGCEDPVFFRVRMGLTFGPGHPLLRKLPLGVGNSPSLQKRTFATLDEAKAYVDRVAKPNQRSPEQGDVVYWSEIVAWRRKVRRFEGRGLGVVTRAELPAATRLLAWRQPDGSVRWKELPRGCTLNWEWLLPEDQRDRSTSESRLAVFGWRIRRKGRSAPRET